MAIQRTNKFDAVVKELNEQESLEEEKSMKVTKSMVKRGRKKQKNVKYFLLIFLYLCMNNLMQLRPLTVYLIMLQYVS